MVILGFCFVFVFFFLGLRSSVFRRFYEFFRFVSLN